MLNSLKISLIILALSLAAPSFSQDSNLKKIEDAVIEDLALTPRLGFGVSAERPLQGAFMVYQNLKESGAKIENFEIVIWGPIVTELKKGEKQAAFIEPFLDEKLTVSVCAVALDRMGVKKSDLLPGIKVVDNAYVHIFRLQSLGYNMIIP